MDHKQTNLEDIKRFVKFAESSELEKCTDVDQLKRMAEELATAVNLLGNQMRRDLTKFKRVDAAYAVIVKRGNALAREADQAKRSRASSGNRRA